MPIWGPRRHIACLLAYFKRTRTPLTSFIHSFRFPMMLFSSAMLKPVSFRSWSTYVVAGLPLFLAPCFGSQSSRSLITSSFFFQQCPINRSLLIVSVSVILGRLSYRSLLPKCPPPGGMDEWMDRKLVDRKKWLLKDPHHSTMTEL